MFPLSIKSIHAHGATHLRSVPEFVFSGNTGCEAPKAAGLDAVKGCCCAAAAMAVTTTSNAGDEGNGDTGDLDTRLPLSGNLTQLSWSHELVHT